MPREISRRSLLAWWMTPLRTVARAAAEERGIRRVVVRHELCVAVAGADCRLCVAVCDRGALAFDEENGPAISQPACDACGACVEACLTTARPAAIRIVEVPS